MADQTNAHKPTTGPDSPKPGSDPKANDAIGGAGDFGVPVGSGPSRQRDYVSRNTKMSDPGAAQPHAGEGGGRTAGVGGTEGGVGSGSGGDVDTDFVGVGTGGSTISASGVLKRPPGPDDSDGTSDEFAAGGHAEGRNQGGLHKVGGTKEVRGGTTFDRSGEGDASTVSPGQGADAATNPGARGDDSFAGEVSSGEAGGQGGV